MGLDMYIVDENGSEVAYWRKFNALHGWFVDHVQGGIDDCNRSRRLTRDDIESILYVMKQIEKNPATASDMLPTREGFFFGPTDYDNWFLDDVRGAINIFESILESIDSENYYYNSSW